MKAGISYSVLIGFLALATIVGCTPKTATPPPVDVAGTIAVQLASSMTGAISFSLGGVPLRVMVPVMSAAVATWRAATSVLTVISIDDLFIFPLF